MREREGIREDPAVHLRMIARLCLPRPLAPRCSARRRWTHGLRCVPRGVRCATGGPAIVQPRAIARWP
jgi:hypothetical protein